MVGCFKYVCQYDIDFKMEQCLECYLEKFKETPRNSLHDRRTRKWMVEYINTLIQGCAGEYGNTDTTSEEAVSTLIKYHNNAKIANGSVCLMGKYHNVLYVAIKLCYSWQIKNAALVCQLLQEIYSCEGTFERIFIGAIFGTKAPHYIAGWKSDFEDQEENVRAVVYFMDKANLGRLQLIAGESQIFCRFPDLPIESCGRASAVRICLQLGLPDKLLILLRFGSVVNCEPDNLEHIMSRLVEFNHCYPYNLVACLQLLLRVIPNLRVTKEILEERFMGLIEDGLVPASRCGYVPVELKHLCRCVIRERLNSNFCLPHGIRQLPLPDNIWKYLDILED